MRRAERRRGGVGAVEVPSGGAGAGGVESPASAASCPAATTRGPLPPSGSGAPAAGAGGGSSSSGAPRLPGSSRLLGSPDEELPGSSRLLGSGDPGESLAELEARVQKEVLEEYRELDRRRAERGERGGKRGRYGSPRPYSPESYRASVEKKMRRIEAGRGAGGPQPDLPSP